jgi:predicted molibdopterin-dependent oxidoreductase YjgC
VRRSSSFNTGRLDHIYQDPHEADVRLWLVYGDLADGSSLDQLVKTIRPDTVFVPYHWPGNKSANLLTNRALDPISKIPEYKVCAVRLRKADAPPEYAEALEPQQ